MNAHDRSMWLQASNSNNSDNFRSAMRHLASGVCVITTGQREHRTGLIATSVSSLTVEPPSLVVCINLASTTLKAMRKNRVFGVNFLSATHRDVATRFSGGRDVPGPARYQGSEWITLRTGVSLLADALAAFQCTIATVTRMEYACAGHRAVRGIDESNGDRSSGSLASRLYELGSPLAELVRFSLSVVRGNLRRIACEQRRR